MLATWLSEELHLIRHLGAGGAEVRPGREGSSGEVPTSPQLPPSLGSVPQKRPSGTGHTPREYELCAVRVRVCMGARTQEEATLSGPIVHRPLMGRYHPLVGQPHSHSSVTTALAEHQDTGEPPLTRNLSTKPTSQQVLGQALR